MPDDAAGYDRQSLNCSEWQPMGRFDTKCHLSGLGQIDSIRRPVCIGSVERQRPDATNYRAIAAWKNPFFKNGFCI